MNGKLVAAFLGLLVVTSLVTKVAMFPPQPAVTLSEPTADNAPGPAAPPAPAPTLLELSGKPASTGPAKKPPPAGSKPATAAPAKSLPVARAELSPEQVVAGYAPAVATVKGKLSSGSGFLIAPGILATNHHVIAIEFVDQLQVHFPSATGKARGPFSATLLAEDAHRDLAFLRIGSDQPHLPLAANYSFRPGQEILVIGSPGSGGPDSESRFVLENAVNFGLMSTQVHIGDQDFYQAGVSVNPGNSGGPLIDLHGQVLGVVTMKRRDKEGITYCIPLDGLRAGLDRVTALKPNAPALAESKHRKAVADDRLTRLTRVYLAALDIYGQALDRASRLQENPNATLMRVAPQIDAQVKSLNRTVTGGLDSNANAAVEDPLLSTAEQQWTLQMWTLCSDTKKLFDSPVRDAGLFRSRYADLQRRFNELAPAAKK